MENYFYLNEKNEQKGPISPEELISAKTAPMNGLCPCVGEANLADPP